MFLATTADQAQVAVSVRGGTALNGLGSVDWGRLHHAYGPATDVPGQVRALAPAEAAQRQKAYYQL